MRIPHVEVLVYPEEAMKKSKNVISISLMIVLQLNIDAGFQMAVASKSQLSFK